jgi:acyl-CoA hydrolase
MSVYVSAEEAVSHVRSGDVVFVHSNAAAPTLLLRALADRAPALRDVEIIHLLLLGPAPHLDASVADSFIHRAYFIGPNARDAVNRGRAFYCPVHLSQYAAEACRREPNVALLTVSPPKKSAYSLGVSVEGAPEAIARVRRNDGLVIAQVNEAMPHVHGRTFIHERDIDFAVECDEPLPTVPSDRPNRQQERIGQLVAEHLIEDGSTLQVGIGSVPDAVVAAAVALGRKDLGVHTEMYTDALMDATKAGAVTNARKTLNPGYSVSALFQGTQPLYEFIHDNPEVQGRPSAYTNNSRNICMNPRVVAINSAIGVDLNGSVYADSLSPTTIYSGYGGQCDFMRGAAMLNPEGVTGRGVIALESCYEKGGELHSKIASVHPAGMNITVNAADPKYVVTEYGIADISGLGLGERARALCAIAHPRFRDELWREAERGGGLTHWITPRARRRGIPDGVMVQVE